MSSKSSAFSSISTAWYSWYSVASADFLLSAYCRGDSPLALAADIWETALSGVSLSVFSLCVSSKRRIMRTLVSGDSRAVAVRDCKVGRDADARAMPAQQSHAYGVERSEDQLRRLCTDKILEPTPHFACSPVGKCDNNTVWRRDRPAGAAQDEPCHARGQDTCLTRSRTRQDLQRCRRVACHRVSLFVCKRRDACSDRHR